MLKVLPCGNEGSSQSQFGRVLRENPIEVSNFVSRFHKDCNYRLLSKDDHSWRLFGGTIIPVLRFFLLWHFCFGDYLRSILIVFVLRLNTNVNISSSCLCPPLFFCLFHEQTRACWRRFLLFSNLIEALTYHNNPCLPNKKWRKRETSSNDLQWGLQTLPRSFPKWYPGFLVLFSNLNDPLKYHNNSCFPFKKWR